MKLRHYSAILLAILLFSASGADPKPLGWAPAHTWIFAVGVLHWKHSEMFGSFPVKDRRDAELVDFFKQQGVPENQIVYLQDRNGTQKRIDAAFNEQLKKIGARKRLLPTARASACSGSWTVAIPARPRVRSRTRKVRAHTLV